MTAKMPFFTKLLVGLCLILCCNTVAQDFVIEPVFWTFFDESTNVENGLIVEMLDQANGNLSLPSSVNQRAALMQIPLLNNQNVAWFDGQNDFYDFNLNIPIPFTLFVVLKPEKTSDNFYIDTQNRMLGRFVPPNIGRIGSSLGFNIITPREWCMLTFVAFDNETIDVYLNETFLTNVENTRGIETVLRIGGAWTNDRYFEGGIGEVLIFDYAMTQANNQPVWDYLKEKYTAPPDLGEDQLILPGCTRMLEVEDRYTEYSWYLLDQSGNEVLLEGDEHFFEAGIAGTYILESMTVFDELVRDTVALSFPDFSDMSNAVVCDGIGVPVNLGLTDTGLTVIWSDTLLIGGQVEIFSSGDYQISLTQNDGCAFDTVFSVLTIAEVVEIQVPEIMCLGNSISATFSLFEDMSFIWNTGQEGPHLQPDEDGQYWLQVTSTGGCIGADTVNVVIQGEAPVVQFGVDQLCEMSNSQFTNLSYVNDESEMSDVQWVIDGVPYLGDTVNFYFDQYGEVEIQLNVTTDVGCSSGYAQTIYIHPIPQIDFNYSLPCSGQPVIFEDSSSIALGSLASWFWNFGDGNTANTPNTLFTFSSPGVGEVSLTVTSDEGCTSVFEAEVPVNPTPQASFVWEKTCQGSQMPFQSTTDTSLTGPLNYAWTFGIAGVIGEGANVQHGFSAPGDYLVTHEVWTTINNLPGCFGQQSQVVTVSPHPVLDFEHTIACAGDPFTLTDLTTTGQSDSIVGRQWIVNGEVINESAEFTYTFPDPGDYNIVLAIQTEAGCSGQLMQTISVGSTIPPVFTVSPEVDAPPAQVQFVNSGSYGAHHIWDFGDGNTSLEIDPIHTYQDTGIFYPQLTVIDEAGCPGIASGEFYAFDPYFDVSIEAVNCTDDNGQITVSGVLGNYNNHRLTSAELRMWLGNGTVVSELWEGSVERNQLVSFTFTSRLNFRDDIHAEYLCVEIANPNGNNPDAVPANNKRCKSISASMFALFPPFPNPADNEIQQFFHLGQSGEVHFRLVQTDGKVIEERRVKRSSGLHSERFQTASLATGVYVLWAEFRGETTFHRVQIIR